LYRVSIFNDGKRIDIHQQNISANKLVEGKVKSMVDGIDTFDFSFYQNNKGYGQIQPLKTQIEVVNTKTNESIFKGRVYMPTDDMASNGLHSTSFVCQSEMGYLTDSVSRHVEWRGSPRNLMTSILNWHNGQVEDFKKFQLGVVEVEDSNDFQYLYLSATRTTYEEILDKIIDRLGGELSIRYDKGVRYLDVLKRIGKQSKTTIKLGKNLRTLSRTVDATEVITRLTPLGARIESEDETATDASEERLTIASVNNGKPYIDREDLFKYYTIKGKSVVWEDVNDPKILLTKGKEYMAKIQPVKTQYTLTAYDLHTIGKAPEEFKIGYDYHVMNPVMNLDNYLRCVELTIDIVSPQESSMVIGDKLSTIYDYQWITQNMKQQLTELSYSFVNQSKRLSDIRNSYADLSQLYSTVSTEKIPSIEKQIKDLGKLIENLTPPTTPTDPPVGSDGYATNRVFPVDYNRSGINFWTKSTQPDMGYGDRSGGFHSGWDIGGGGASHPIHATTDGVVRKSEFMSGGIGNAIYIEHTADAYWSNYMHLASISVSVGQTVKAGDRIGTMGNTGGDYAIHLHYEISPNGSFHSGGNTINPQAYLGITGDNTTSLPRPV